MILECSRCGGFSNADAVPGKYGLWQCDRCARPSKCKVPDWDAKEFRKLAGHKPDNHGGWAGPQVGRKVKKSRGFGRLSQ